MVIKSLAITLLSSCMVYGYTFNYPSALPNHDLKEEIAEQEDRLVPKSDWVSAAVDGHSFLRNLGGNDFYHGIGYWIQGRTEFSPHENFHLNMRSIFYSGSISAGYAEPTGNYHLIGISGKWPEPVLGGTLEGRTMDLERQTIGQGLIIEEKEIAGVWFKWSRGDHTVKLMGDGTGGLLLYDDLQNLEVNLFNGYVGFGTIMWNAGNQSALPRNRDPYYYITSGQDFKSNLGYFAELGSRNSKYAGLAGVKYFNTFGRLTMNTRVQLRSYSDLFGADFVGQVQQVYVAYDQYDKRYTNTANVFVVDDDVQVYSLVLDLQYQLSEKSVAHFKNEVGKFDYKQFNDENFYFYRLGITYFPIEGRKESFTLFASNKVLTESYVRPPSNRSLVNSAAFKRVGHLGLEAAFRF